MNLNSRNIKATLGIMMVCIAGLCAASAQAATITVTANAPDVLNGANASCSLREAITNINNAALTYADCANTGDAYGTSDTINLPAGTYTNLILGADEFVNATGSLDILTSVTITGAGAGSTTINGWAIDRALYIGSGITVSISGVTITNGSSLATGSGFYNLGTTTLTSSIITGNFSSNVAGGIENNTGSLTITDSTVSGNSALNNAGGILNTGGTVTITNSTVSGNTALNNGGGIYNNGGTVAITNNSFINGNTATWHGGGIYNWAGTVTATDSTISGNTATTFGGSYGGGIRNLANATITNTTISGNTAENGGGGIASSGPLTVTNSTISGNSVSIGGIGGGGIYNSSTLTATDTTISGNTATFNGGGIYNNTGTVTSTNSTINSNTAAWDGGGIFNDDIATITNTTISGNTATTDSGGGIFNNNGTLTVTNSTIVRNTAPAGTGGGYKLLAGTGAFANSIVADNGAGQDCVGAITDNGGNIDKDSTCTGFTHTAAMVQGTGFSALSNNGGATQTHALLAGSAAIDAGDNTICAAAPVSNASQNGVTRPLDGDGNSTTVCDIGAYEAPAVPDATPDAFSFAAQTGVALATPTTSNTITVSGINAATPISISAGGSYSINGGAYTSVAGTVNNGDMVTLRQTSSGSFSTLTTATLTIGGVAGTFDVTTLAMDTIPDAFSFTAQTGVALNSVATSNTITLAGINSASAISIAGGTYSVNGGAYTSVAGSVSNGDTVTLRQTSSGSYATLTTATLTIGGVSGAFSVTTLAAPTSYTGPTATGTGNATAVISGAGCGFTAAQFVPLAVSPPSGVSFPHGLFNFTLGNCTPGGMVTLNITYPNAIPAGTQYWKYGPTSDNHSSHWYTIPATISGNTMTFSITDGGLGDDDYTANGIIADAGGPGVQAQSSGVAAIPTLSEWCVILLAGMLGVFGMAGMRRRGT
jgi:hypothetical protein